MVPFGSFVVASACPTNARHMILLDAACTCAVKNEFIVHTYSTGRDVLNRNHDRRHTCLETAMCVLDVLSRAIGEALQ